MKDYLLTCVTDERGRSVWIKVCGFDYGDDVEALRVLERTAIKTFRPRKRRHRKQQRQR